MQRTDLMDTSEWAHREIVRRLRLMTPEEKLQILFQRIEMGREIDRLAKSRIMQVRESQK